MTIKDKEFYELQLQFEKAVAKVIYGHKIERTKKGTAPTGIFYDDGYINTLFKVYMLGYENAKCLARLDAI